MESTEDKLKKELSSSDYAVVKSFGSHAKDLILSKIESGYKIDSSASDHVSVKKGYSYYCITRGGSIWAE